MLFTGFENNGKSAAMNASPILIVPGFKGSGPGHWQSWLQTQIPDSKRIGGINWDEPVLATWAERVRGELARARRPVQIIAHSFGCLATVVAAADRPEQVADLVFTAATQRYYADAGHPLDFSNKAFEMAEMIGVDSAAMTSAAWRSTRPRSVSSIARGCSWISFSM